MGGYYDPQARAPKVEELFTKIARRYDLVNDVQSLGMHRSWKRRLLEMAAIKSGDRVLDLATGTGDLIRMGRARVPETEWCGVDFTYAMLRAAKPGSRLIQGDILKLPLRDRSFSVATMAYGLRNVADRARALAEIRRVLKPGGRFVFLEFAKPKSKLLRSAYFRWLDSVQPLLGRLFFGDEETYRYISKSLNEYPEVDGVSRELEGAGFGSVRASRLFGGMMSIHIAQTS
jgi:demethylmenaquinone methyltransferase / 2-methoxy-6-polyprenyl-1,4-benzoquinol methylase